MSETKSLGDMMPVEQARVRELMLEYQKIGPAGAFGLMTLEQALAQADKAVMSGDVTEMLVAYQGLQECK